MFVEKISLVNFRNYSKSEIDLSKKINILIGKNAQGKTSLIEAIYLSLNGRMFKSVNSDELIRFNSDKSLITSIVSNSISQKINHCELDRADKIKLFIDGVEQKKRDVPLNTILFSPSDLDIVQGAPDSRRGFLDETTELMVPNHRYYRINFYKALKQRNFILKRDSHNKKSMLKTWDTQLVKYGSRIIINRLEALNNLNKYFSKNYHIISGRQNSCDISYCSKIDLNGSDIESSFEEELHKHIEEDIINSTTSVGPHRDDLKMSVNKKDSKKFCSQGEQRSIILALRLSQVDLIKNERGNMPVLLLDDVMSELDDERQQFLIDKIEDLDQIIFTSTNFIYFKEPPVKSATYKVENGACQRWKN